MAPLIHLVELASEHRNPEAFDVYTRLYLARDSTSAEAARLRTAHALARGPAADSLAAIERLAQLPASDLEQITLKLRDPAWHNARSEVLDELESSRHPLTDRASSYYFWRNLFEAWRGRPSAAQEALNQAVDLRPDHPTGWFYQLANLSVGLGDSVIADRAIERNRELGTLDTPMGRWILAAYYLRQGETDRAAANADTLGLQADSPHAAGDSVAARIANGLAAGLRGLLAAGRGDYQEATGILRRSVLQSSSLGSEWIAIDQQRITLASALAEIGEESEALRILESGFRLEAYWSIPAALLRAQLYERRGEREKAIRDYAWLADLLEDCDPEFQPQRELAQRALAQLTGER
jgi:tetratricopeptide (TPR) repeat protein